MEEYVYLKSKKLFNSFRTEIIHGAHLIALSNALILLISLVVIGRYTNWPILFAISYLIIFIIYNFNHVFEMDQDTKSNPSRTGHLENRVSLYKFLMVSAFAALMFLALFFTNVQTLFFSVFLLSMDLFYPKQYTKKIIGFKDIYVSFFWSLIIFLPIFYYSLRLTSGYLLLFFFIFLRTLINVTFCDIKDIESDRQKNLKTIPVIYGKEKTIKFLEILNIGSCLVLAVTVLLGLLPLFTIFLLLLSLYSYFYLSKAKKADRQAVVKISYTLVDGEAVFWIFALILGKILLGRL